MNLLLLEPHDIVGDQAELGGRRADHLLDILKVTPGRTLRAGIVDGPTGIAEVVAIGQRQVVVRVDLTDPPPPPLPVTLWLGLPRPRVLARVLQAIAAIGVARLELTNAWRVDKAYFGSSKMTPAAIRTELLIGAEQGGTSRLPAVTIHERWLTLVEAGTGDARHALVAHARGGIAIECAVGTGPMVPTVVAIGPEGGWVDRELETFVAKGFQVVSLGAPILRTEAAVVALLSQLMLLGRLPAA